MKKVIVILSFIFLFCTVSIKAQVTVSQEFVDDANKAFQEVVVLRDSLEKFKNERKLSEIERQSADKLIQGFNQLIDIKDKTIDQYQKIVLFQQQIIELQQKIITDLQKQYNKPKSAIQKFFKGALDVLKAGVFILVGRGLASL